jgi:hypothetical protein
MNGSNFEIALDEKFDAVIMIYCDMGTHSNENRDKILQKIKKYLTKGKSYSFKIPMVLGGKATTDNVEIFDLVVWVSIIGQIHKQVKEIPQGQK